MLSIGVYPVIHVFHLSFLKQYLKKQIDVNDKRISWLAFLEVIDEK